MTVNNRFIPVHASMADLVILANEMCRTDPQLKMDRELLEYLLVSHFGFDKTKNIFCEKIDGKKVCNWYESEKLEHVSRLTSKRVVCERFVGAERLDKDWLDTGLMSNEAWKVYRGV